MKVRRIYERGGEELYDFKKALKKAKHAIEVMCELSDEMEDKYSERDDDDEDDEHETVVRKRVRR